MFGIKVSPLKTEGRAGSDVVTIATGTIDSQRFPFENMIAHARSNHSVVLGIPFFLGLSFSMRKCVRSLFLNA